VLVKILPLSDIMDLGISKSLIIQVTNICANYDTSKVFRTRKYFAIFVKQSIMTSIISTSFVTLSVLGGSPVIRSMDISSHDFLGTGNNWSSP
jgi:hypothetical protein